MIAKLNEQRALEAKNPNQAPIISNDEVVKLRKYKSIVDASIHPDTK